MGALVVGVVAMAILWIALSARDRARRGMLEHYDFLEGRFGLKRKTYRSRWGWGIGERYSLGGDYRGYRVALYDHFQGEGASKRIWTSLVFEAPFAGELDLVIEPVIGDDRARFPRDAASLKACSLPVPEARDQFEAYSSCPDFFGGSWSGELERRLSSEAVRLCRGSIRLSKGFLEYRESGLIDSAPRRERFGFAFALLADLADRISVHRQESKANE